MSKKRAHNYGYRHYGWWDRIPTDEPVDPLRLANLLKEVDPSHTVTIEPDPEDSSRYRSRCSRCPMTLDTSVSGISNLGALLSAVRKHGRLRTLTIFGRELRGCVALLSTFKDCEITVVGSRHPISSTDKHIRLETQHELKWTSSGGVRIVGRCLSCNYVCTISGPYSLPAESGGDELHRSHIRWLLCLDELTPEVILAEALSNSDVAHCVEIEEDTTARRSNTLALMLGRQAIPEVHVSCSSCDLLDAAGWPVSYGVDFALAVLSRHGSIRRIAVTGSNLRRHLHLILELRPQQLVVKSNGRLSPRNSAPTPLPDGHQIQWSSTTAILAKCDSCEFECEIDPRSGLPIFEVYDPAHAEVIRWLLDDPRHRKTQKP